MKSPAPSFQVLFIITVSLLTFLITISLTFFISKQYKDEAMEHLIHYSQMIAQDLSLATTNYIITESFSSLQDFVLSYHDRPHINAISISNLSGLTIAASQPERLGQHIDIVQTGEMASASTTLDFTSWTMEYLLPVQLSGEIIGWCKVVVNTEQLRGGLASIQKRAIFFGIVCWLLACVISIFISSFITRSITKILHVAQNVSSGNFNGQTEVKGPREIRQLSIAFNAMTNAIENRENLLKSSESKFRSLVEDLYDWVWEVDENSVYTYASPTVEQMLGFTPEEILGKTPFDFMETVEAERMRKIFHKYSEHNSAFKGLINTNLHKNGSEVILETSAQAIIDEEGLLKGYRGVDRDITQRQYAEQALQDEKERLRVTLRSIGDAVITTNTEGKITFLNNMAEVLTGWVNKEAIGKPSAEVFNIINKKTGEKCVSPVQRVFEDGGIIGLANHTALIAKDGTIRSIADSCAPIRDRDGNVIGGVLVFRDVTHEKKIEEELLKVRKLEAVGVLAGGIAHDFNNILSAILGNIELVRYRIAKDDTDTNTLLSDAKKATRRASKLTAQLLTFSKGGDPVKEETSLAALVTESADFVLHGSNVVCNYKIPKDLWVVDVDSGQISQVIQNIIINAKHAMPEGGTVAIQCANVQDAGRETLLSVDKGDYIRINVQDTGIGIPKEIIDKIFDPYFTTKQEGSGLGLAICHSIVNKHGGYLTVSSISGTGSTFTIYLPAIPSSTNKGTLKDEVAALSVKTVRVMVMDDEEMLLKVAKSQLTLLGHEPILVADGTQAINKYREMQDLGTPVDLVIMDLTIPGGMGGKEAVEKLLQIDPEAKIIVASGYSNDPVMANFKKYGFRASVVKPFDLKELNNAISSALCKPISLS